MEKKNIYNDTIIDNILYSIVKHSYKITAIIFHMIFYCIIYLCCCFIFSDIDKTGLDFIASTIFLFIVFSLLINIVLISSNLDSIISDKIKKWYINKN